MTDSEFYETIQTGITVAQFSSESCLPCKIVSPALEELEIEFRGRVLFLKIDVEEYPELSLKFRVLGVPTVILFQNGEPVDVMYEAYPKRIYCERILRKLELTV